MTLNVNGRPDIAPHASAAAYAAAAVGVAFITALIHVIPGASHLANIAMLYLLAVIGTALQFGRRSAIAASFLAFVAFNWFFTEPHYTLTVKDPGEWLALFTFLFTAIVTGHLTALLRARAEEAKRRERETAALAEASWAVASRLDRDTALAEVLRRLSDVVEVQAAAIVIRDTDDGLRQVARLEKGPPIVLPEGPVRLVLEHGCSIGWQAESRLGQHRPAEAPDPGGIFLPLAADDRVMGVLYLGLDKDLPIIAEVRRVVESLANHAAVVLERDRLASTETQARALAEADRLKTALLSMVSHDFRSPLATIRASATALLQAGNPIAPETQRELLAGIDHEAERLNRMVGNILALSRLEADAWRPQREPTHPTELVGTVLQAFGADENRRVRVTIDPHVADAHLDPVQIVQVLHNLVDNALKYSPADQPVELRVSRQNEHISAEVLDRGPGLSPGEEERVFERFYRSPHLRESAVPGVGIGLAVCRGLVEAHGGRLTAHNRVDGGALFRFTLPLHPDTLGVSEGR